MTYLRYMVWLGTLLFTSHAWAQQNQPCREISPGCPLSYIVQRPSPGSPDYSLSDALYRAEGNRLLVLDQAFNQAPSKDVHAIKRARLRPGFSYRGGNVTRLRFTAGPLAETRGRDSITNYHRVVESVYTQPVQDLLGVAALPASAIRQQVTYLDGLGRVMQTISQRANTQNEDLVNLHVYDDLGRSTRQYLSYSAPDTYGEYQEQAIADQAAFYQTTSNKVATDAFPFSEATVEASPLARVWETGAPGAPWQLGQHTRQQGLQFNTANQVIQWSSSGEFLRYYPANSLRINTLDDENGNGVRVFVDPQGKEVYKEVQIGPKSWAKTYSLYDAFDRLVYVVQPEGVEAILADNPTTGYRITDHDLSGYLFSYAYDARGRMIEKTSPGTGPMFMVYDQKGRLVLTQDANLRTSNQWSYIKYDQDQRPVQNGFYTDQVRMTRQAMQAYVASIDLSGDFKPEETPKANTALGYSNQAFPKVNTTVTVVNYYGTYDFDADGIADYSYQSAGLGTEKPTPHLLTDNWLTGTRVRVLGESNWITSAVFYDEYGQNVQTQSNNTVNYAALDLTTKVYDYEGKLMKVKSQVTTQGTETVVNRWTYYENGALHQVYQQNNQDPEQLVVKLAYNEMNQLVEKNLHGTSTGFLQSIDYRYNIRGWLTHLNNETLTNDGVTNDDANDLFGMEFHYAEGVPGLNNTPTYNGNVSAISWQVNDAQHQNTPQRPRAYTFAYDGMDQLKQANYAAKENGQWTAEMGGYAVSNLAYDKNGNLLSLQRNQWSATTQQVEIIDQLTYAYQPHSNQLQAVEDSAPTTGGFLNGSSTAQEYTWSEAGDLTADANKDITGITYNALGKTEQVSFADGKFIAFTYLADGTRIRKTSNDGTRTQVTDYVGSLVLENQQLSYYSMPEGRVRVSGNQRIFEYFITDHQGNTRISFEADRGVAKVVQENHYYPFGLTMGGGIQNTPLPSEPNRRLYNGGAELQDDFGGAYGIYSTFYREYDPVLGRFNAVDPKVDMLNATTPYQYAFNNPIRFNDPNGDIPRRISVADMVWDRSFGGCVYCDPGGSGLNPGIKFSDWNNSIHGASAPELRGGWSKLVGDVIGGSLSKIKEGKIYNNNGNNQYFTSQLYLSEVFLDETVRKTTNTGEFGISYEYTVSSFLGYRLRSSFDNSLIAQNFGNGKLIDLSKPNSGQLILEAIRSFSLLKLADPGYLAPFLEEFIDLRTNFDNRNNSVGNIINSKQGNRVIHGRLVSITIIIRNHDNGNYKYRNSDNQIGTTFGGFYGQKNGNAYTQNLRIDNRSGKGFISFTPLISTRDFDEAYKFAVWMEDVIDYLHLPRRKPRKYFPKD